MIDRFDGKHSFLSNFYKSPFTYGGQEFPTVEHAYQASKTSDPELQLQIIQAMSPADAKRVGRRVPLIPDWEARKIPVMRSLLVLKFSTESELASKLQLTAPHLLVEGNYWGDRFWGVTDGTGHNWLGHLLMARRAELLSVGSVLPSIDAVVGGA